MLWPPLCFASELFALKELLRHPKEKRERWGAGELFTPKRLLAERAMFGKSVGEYAFSLSKIMIIGNLGKE